MNVVCPKIEITIKKNLTEGSYVFTIKYNDFSENLIDTTTRAQNIKINGEDFNIEPKPLVEEPIGVPEKKITKKKEKENEDK